jgi:hypothetical protein
MMPPMSVRLKVLAWHPLAIAVLTAFRMDDHQEKFTPKATADVWVSDSALWKDLRDRVRDLWCRYAEQPLTMFPYSEDFVVRVYSWLRLQKEKQLVAAEMETELAAENRRRRRLPDAEPDMSSWSEKDREAYRVKKGLASQWPGWACPSRRSTSWGSTASRCAASS